MRIATGTCIACLLGSVASALALGAVGDATAPGAPPIAESAFPFESAGKPVDNDGKIPAPSTPAAPICTETITAPANGSVTALQAQIDSDVGARGGFAGDTICLQGTFKSPIHVRGKFSRALLTIAAAPGATAVFDLTGRAPAVGDEDPNAHDNGDIGAIEIGGSRDVEIYGLTIKNWVTTSAAFAPAGIYVTVSSDSGSPVSPCFTKSADFVCGDIFLYDNTIERIENSASGCGNGNINAFGIAVKAFGQDPNAMNATHALQHVVLEGNTVAHTATGQSETVTIDGNVTDFLVSGNTITHVDNLGLDAIGWETQATSASQARHGVIVNNKISDVDTTTNLSGYGHMATVGGARVCVPGDDQAAGLYVDGGSYLWMDGNTVTDTNHGIELGVENNGADPSGNPVPGAEADHLLVTDNTVTNDPGTTFSGSSYAGHASDALLIDGGANGNPGTVVDVYVHNNDFSNPSQFYNDGTTSPTHGLAAPVIDLANSWQNVWLLENSIAGGGSSDRLNPLLSVETKAAGSATAAPGVVVDCNDYRALSNTPPGSADNFDFSVKGNSWDALAAYQAGNRMPTAETGVTGWDANAVAEAPAPNCPFTPPDDGPATGGGPPTTTTGGGGGLPPPTTTGRAGTPPPTTTTGGEAPPPPPAPTCSLTARRATVVVHERKHRRRGALKPGTVVVAARCSQDVTATLTGVVTERRKHARKAHSFKLVTVHSSLKADVRAQLRMTLPRRALIALGKHAAESIRFTLVASNASGSALADAIIRRLKPHQ